MNAIDEELKEEIIETLNFTVNSGYYSEEEIRTLCTEYLDELVQDEDLPSLSQEDITKLIDEIRSFYTNSSGTNYSRLREVFDQLNRERVIAVDYAGFDMSEGHEDVGEVFQFMKENNIPRNGYCFFHQQDIERSMDPTLKNLLLAFHSTDGDEEVALAVGQRIEALLGAAGFSVLWDHTLDQRICIQDFQWDKTYNGEDTGVQRAIRVMAATHLG